VSENQASSPLSLASDTGISQTDDSQQFPPLKTPFGKIALALSGGGFRAASYSIGAMSYLDYLKYKDENGNERNLLENVQFISSASGGSFAGMLYSAYLKQGKSFRDAYDKIKTFMNGTGLLEEVLKLINNDSEWEGREKSRNFINAFSRIYDQHLFDGKTFGVYWNAGNDIEVCVNATEFYRGISFRFQTDGKLPVNDKDKKGKTGNAYIFFDTDTDNNLRTLQQVKLGDILAASSCFPAGFEPIIYPQDFTYKGLDSNALQQAMIITDYNNAKRSLDMPVGLMDGGINDNQGMSSAMLADERRRDMNKENGFDLIMATDVASYFMDAYVPPVVNEKGSRGKSITDHVKDFSKTLRGINKIVNIMGIAAIAMLLVAVGLLNFTDDDGWRNIGFLVLSPAILLLLIAAFIIGYRMGNPLLKRITRLFNASDRQLVTTIKEGLPAVGNFSDDSIQLLVKYLKDSPVGVVEQMLSARVNSMLSLVLEVNLKQTRRLIFDSFYDNAKWDNRRVFNVIYELSLFNKVARESKIVKKFGGYTTDDEKADAIWSKACIELLTKGCEQMISIAEDARTMGTTLWYDSKDARNDRMKKVIACGQFTTCAKMLEYALVTERLLDIEDKKKPVRRALDFSDHGRAMFKELRQKLELDWIQFKKDPYFVYNAYGK
jgi:hypothetical protein